jgi:hypothetical protein
MKLLYHTRTLHKNVSPFDSAMLDIVNGSVIKLVCPYIGLSYLRRLTAQCLEWRLVTDVNEWLGSTTPAETGTLLDFLQSRSNQIRHFAGVHAKAVIGSKSAYFGSANLTQAGILARTELGMRLDTPAAIAELSLWFEGLWTDSERLRADELTALQAWRANGSKLGREPAPKDKPRVGSGVLRAVSVQAALPLRQQAADSEKVVATFIEQWADVGFTVQELIDELRESGYRLPPDQVRELLAPYCAGQVSTVFAVDTVHRLIVREERYQQSTAELLGEHIAPFDTFLETMIAGLDFAQWRTPAFDELAQASNLAAEDCRQLTAQLLETKFLQFEGGLARLQEGWPWSRRFQLFANAHRKWLQKYASHQLRTAGRLPAPASVSPGSSSPASAAISIASATPITDTILMERAGHSGAALSSSGTVEGPSNTSDTRAYTGPALAPMAGLPASPSSVLNAKVEPAKLPTVGVSKVMSASSKIIDKSALDRGSVALLQYAWYHGNPLPFIELDHLVPKLFPAPDDAAAQALTKLLDSKNESWPLSLQPLSATDRRLLLKVRQTKEVRTGKGAVSDTSRYLSDVLFSRGPLLSKGQGNEWSNGKWHHFERTHLLSAKDVPSVYKAIWYLAQPEDGRLNFASELELYQHLFEAKVKGVPNALRHLLAVGKGTKPQLELVHGEGSLRVRPLQEIVVSKADIQQFSKKLGAPR